MARRGAKSNRGGNLGTVRSSKRSNQEPQRAQVSSSNGRATLRGGRRPQGEARDSQHSSQVPQSAHFASNDGISTLPPRPSQGQDSSQLNRGSRSTMLPSTVPAQHPLPPHPGSSQEGDRSSRPLSSGPEHLQSEHDLHARAKLPMRPVQPPDDAWSVHGYREILGRGWHPQHQAAEYSQARLHEAYRQRTPEPRRYQPEYLPLDQPYDFIQQRPSVNSRDILAYRPVRDVLGVRSRSKSPPAPEPLRSTNSAVATTAVPTSRVDESHSGHVGDDLRSAKKCGNCKREGHEVKDCVSKVGRSGYVMACPRCNSSRHLYDRCPSSNVPAPGTREREEDDLYYLVTCRQNKPQICHRVDLGALMQWTTPSLTAFPWSAAFALRYHEDPKQAAAERDYDYSKHDFGLAGRRPDREALTRKFDPSHPVIPKIPLPTTLPAPSSVPREAEDRQGAMLLDDTSNVENAAKGADPRADATRAGFETDGDGSATTPLL
ncbi:uncharacterized protein PG998_008537 [Apiospora kogelbergensis]|uniref:uncharacterized protein n=1 Tax=Apiospora kogelbergensis TaxID=1337665 RepID=UPI00312D0BF8